MWMLALISELNHFLPMQFNFGLEAKDYRVCIVNKKTYSLLFYQYVTSTAQRSMIIIPDGCADIQFSCNADNPIIDLCGTTFKSEEKEHKPGQLYIGVRFSPSVSRRIGWFPYSHLANKRVSAGSINRASQATLDQLCIATSFAERIELIDKWLTKLGIPTASATDEIDFCLGEIHKCAGNIRLTTLARDLGYSDRRIRQMFTAEMGIAPKLYCRIQRFQQALLYLTRSRHGSVSNVELVKKFGYYDEAHAIKEFQLFSQHSPLALQNKLLQAEKIKTVSQQP